MGFWEDFERERERIGPGPGQFEDTPMVDSGIRVKPYGEPEAPDVLSLLDNPVDVAKVRKLLRTRWSARGWRKRPKQSVVKVQHQPRLRGFIEGKT